ncbi:M60 family metallopeptidase [Leifsonia sp. F6_8S_P_1B]|uniref:M60 family metallopeptidase n=1 Tax=Leifsonia williamsii TaxID=3035919 RepID=A0ABT8K6F7_9MICO|nr:M60 family metallopeptidase [Leifsonia williamsii]MDN4613029.1 M60 family metallopeptidase [Leifsonia williamsii]
MTHHTRHGGRALLASATAVALAAAGLLVAAPAGAATPDPAALPLQASSLSGSALIPSLTVSAAGKLQVTMSSTLYRSTNRVVLWVDGKYAAETYNGSAYYLAVSGSGDVVTLASTTTVASGQTVRLGLQPGVPGNSTDPAKALVLASTIAGQSATVAADGRMGYTVAVPEAVYRSSKRVIAWVDGAYSAEAATGKSYYFDRVTIADGVATLHRSTPVRGGTRIEVGVVPGAPGGAYDKSTATLLASTTLTSAPRVQVGAAASTLQLASRGDAEADRKRENRGLRHSTLEPVGRYVKKGDSLRVALPGGTSDVRLAVGQYGPYAALNGGSDLGVKTTALAGGTSTVIADRDGLVYLEKVAGGPVEVTVSGGAPVPMFTLGQTSPAEFALELSLFPDSPLVVTSTERTVAAFQRPTVLKNQANLDNARLASWDQVVNVTDRTYGLSLDGAGLDRKSPARVYISSPDTGAGYAYATQDRISFQVGTGAADHLFTAPVTDQWGLWHEIGHTYQTQQYKWAGLGEVTVNISSIAVQLGLGQANRLAQTGTANAITAYLAKPDATRVYDDETDLFVKLGMFDDLRAKFGDDFYPRLNKQYRAEAAAGVVSPTDTAGMQKRFMKTASAVAGTDLTSYFASWGLR